MFLQNVVITHTAASTLKNHITDRQLLFSRFTEGRKYAEMLYAVFLLCTGLVCILIYWLLVRCVLHRCSIKTFGGEKNRKSSRKSSWCTLDSWEQKSSTEQTKVSRTWFVQWHVINRTCYFFSFYQHFHHHFFTLSFHFQPQNIPYPEIFPATNKVLETNSNSICAAVSQVCGCDSASSI